MSDRFEKLRGQNPQIQWIRAQDEAFSAFGRVLDIDCAPYVAAAAEIPMAEKVAYEASHPALEAVENLKKRIRDEVYGRMPIETGYCCGHNRSMNAMEFHQGSEVNVMITDAVLLLAPFDRVRRDDRAKKMTFDSKDCTAVYVPAGTAVEIFSLVLHFTPIEVDDKGFFTLVILPEGTNLPLDPDAANDHRDPYLRAVNKWLLAHPDMGIGSGIVGENITVRV